MEIELLAEQWKFIDEDLINHAIIPALKRFRD